MEDIKYDTVNLFDTLNNPEIDNTTISNLDNNNNFELSDIVLDDNYDPIINSSSYQRKKEINQLEKPQANFRYISTMDMPRGVLALYNILTHEIYMPQFTMSEGFENWVYHHEHSHYLGEKNEYKCDRNADMNSNYSQAA